MPVSQVMTIQGLDEDLVETAMARDGGLRWHYFAGLGDWPPAASVDDMNRASAAYDDVQPARMFADVMDEDPMGEGYDPDLAMEVGAETGEQMGPPADEFMYSDDDPEYGGQQPAAQTRATPAPAAVQKAPSKLTDAQRAEGYKKAALKMVAKYQGVQKQFEATTSRGALARAGLVYDAARRHALRGPQVFFIGATADEAVGFLKSLGVNNKKVAKKDAGGAYYQFRVGRSQFPRPPGLAAVDPWSGEDYEETYDGEGYAPESFSPSQEAVVACPEGTESVTHTYTGRPVTQCLDPMNAAIAKRLSGQASGAAPVPGASGACPPGTVPGITYHLGQPKWGCAAGPSMTQPLTAAKPKVLPCPPGRVRVEGQPGCVSQADVARLKTIEAARPKPCNPGWVWWPGSPDRTAGCMAQSDYDKRMTARTAAAKAGACPKGQTPYPNPVKPGAWLCHPTCPAGAMPLFVDADGLPTSAGGGYFEACLPTYQTQQRADDRYVADEAAAAAERQRKAEVDAALKADEAARAAQAEADRIAAQEAGVLTSCIQATRDAAVAKYGPLGQFMLPEEDIQATCKAQAAPGLAGLGEVGADAVWLKVTPRATTLGAYRGFFAVFGPTYDSLVGVKFGG